MTYPNNIWIENKQNNSDNKPEPQKSIHWNKLGGSIASKSILKCEWVTGTQCEVEKQQTSCKGEQHHQ